MLDKQFKRFALWLINKANPRCDVHIHAIDDAPTNIISVGAGAEAVEVQITGPAGGGGGPASGSGGGSFDHRHSSGSGGAGINPNGSVYGLPPNDCYSDDDIK